MNKPESKLPPSLTLPLLNPSRLDLRPVDWGELPRGRFMDTPGHGVPGESECLIALMRSVNAQYVVEFGCHEGIRSKLALLNVPSIKSYIGIDVPSGYVTASQVQRKEVPQRPGHWALNDVRFRLRVHPNGSHDVSPVEIGIVDVAFIDGDHSEAGVINDTALADATVRVGGIIIWHDYHALVDKDGNELVGVRKVLEERAAAGHQIVHVDYTWLAYERR